MRALIVEATSGISGDMFVAAAARLCACEGEVSELPGKLGLADVRCTFKDVIRCGLAGRKFDVLLGKQAAEDAHHHHHHHSGSHHHGPAPHPEHRSIGAIRDLIGRAGLDPAVIGRAIRMFERLGAVEAEVHGIPLEGVHFHEVGAVDSIVDIVAAALCIERLRLDGAFATPVCVGSGTIQTAHGRLPVPAPATEKLLQGMPTLAGDLPGEWTTPTGALILAELKPDFSDAVLVTQASAAGAGRMDTPLRPNLLRLRLAGSAASAAPVGPLQGDQVVVITTNLDDSSGELLGADFIDRLLKSGARDAVLLPVVMKKGRPGQQLEVTADPDRAEALAQLILAHTSTIGVRLMPVRRLILPREPVILATAYGEVAAKRVLLPDGSTRTAPEYESCRALAEKAGVPIQTVFRAALAAAGP